MRWSRSQLFWMIVGFFSLASGLSSCRTTSGGGRTAYVVKIEKGDTPSGLAQKYDTTVAKILRLNGLRSIRELYVGQTIRVEPGPSGNVISSEASRLPPRVKAGTARREDQPASQTSEIAKPDEFSEEDFPAVEEVPSSNQGGESKAERKGLLFGSPKDEKTKGQHGAGQRLTWPVRGQVVSRYGKRGQRFHYGIDIAVPTGAGISPAAPGKVIFAGEKSGYGRVVIVEHKDLQTLYAHLSLLSVALGDEVHIHSILGEVGKSGNASGPHLHFEVKGLNGRLMDPLMILAPSQEIAARSRAA